MFIYVIFVLYKFIVYFLVIDYTYWMILPLICQIRKTQHSMVMLCYV